MKKNSEKIIKVISPAKVNLFLAVGKKGEGVNKNFHPLLNIFHSLLLHDILYFNYEESNNLEINIEFLESDNADIQIPEICIKENLVYKAITSLSEKLSKNTNKKINIFIEKNIPLQAGLAGGSSNAAAALIAAAKIFDIKVDNPAIITTAKEIGSDVSFFLQGGCALYSGAGDILENKIQPINREILLVRPFCDSGLSTKDVYKCFDDLNLAADLDSKFDANDTNNSVNITNHNHEKHEHCHDDDCSCNHKHDDKYSLKEITKELTYADNIPLFNNLAPASEQLMPELCTIREWLESKVGKENVLLCGSGSATFAIIPDNIDIEEISEQAQKQGFWVMQTQLANVKARIVPTLATF